MSDEKRCEACDGDGWLDHVDGRVDCDVCGGARTVDETKAIMRVIELRESASVQTGRITTLAAVGRAASLTMLATTIAIVAASLFLLATKAESTTASKCLFVTLAALNWAALIVDEVARRRENAACDARSESYAKLERLMDLLRAMHSKDSES